MEGHSGIRVFAMPLNVSPDTLPAPFGGGRSLPGFIVRSGDGIAVQLVGVRVPLPTGAGGFEPGQRVAVALVVSENGRTIQVTSVSPAHSEPATAPSAPAALVAAVLEALGALSPVALAAANEILPKQVSLPEGAMRAFFALFVARRDAGRALATLSTVLVDALAGGVITPEIAREVKAFADSMKAADAKSFRAALQSVRSRMGAPIEGQLAGLLESGGELDESFFVRLLHMRGDAKLAAFLRDNGQWSAFDSAVNTLLEQFRGVELQHLRAPDLPYQFIELPLDPQAGFTRVQIHFFGEDSASRDPDASGTSIVMLDLSLSNLGDLWITLRTAGENCTCRIEATRADIVDLIVRQSGDLSSALAQAGYSAGASVDASLWGGDRLEAVANAFRGLSGLDLSA